MRQRPLLFIVDDDVRTATLLGRMLRDDGFDTEVEQDGAAAVARLAQAPVFDALITDFHLPGADGLAVARGARAARLAMPIFVVTGDPHAVGRAEPAPDGPVELITKPINYAGLVRRLHALLAVSTT